MIALPCSAESRKTRIQNDLSQLVVALVQYRTEYGAFPSGKSLAVIGALTGTNSKHIVFIEWSERSLDANGRFLDQWGSPYLITFPDTESVEVRSAGPDKTFNTPDDKYIARRLLESTTTSNKGVE